MFCIVTFDHKTQIPKKSITKQITCKYVAFMYSDPSTPGFFDKIARLVFTLKLNFNFN